MQVTLLERMDRETRALTLLAVAAVVFVIAAAFALASSARVVKPAFEPEPFFPGLAQRLGAIREIVIETKDESVRIVGDAKGHWVLPQKDNYPVRRGPLREITLGLGELMKVQPATANPEWHKELRLGAPDKGGEATRVTLKGEGGTELASLLVGEKADLPDISGLDSWYVRQPGDMQSWLARGTLSLHLDPTDWIVTDVVPLKADRIRSATITPAEGPSYTVAREDEKADSFTLKTVPEGASVRGPHVADGVGQAIAGLKIRDVQLASDFNFENAPTAQYRTFDGLEITVHTLEVGKDIWATIEARFDGQKGGDATKSFNAGSLAADINQHVAGWAFLLPAYEGHQMRLPVTELLKQPETAAAATPEGAAPAAETAAPVEGGNDAGSGTENTEKTTETPPPAEPAAKGEDKGGKDDKADKADKDAPAKDAGAKEDGKEG